MFLRSAFLGLTAAICAGGMAIAADVVTAPPVAAPAVAPVTAPVATEAKPADMAAPVATVPMTPPAAAEGINPCKRIKEECEHAGYIKGGAKDGKGLKANCMKPILDGQTVAGINPLPMQIVADCKVKRAKWMEMKKNGMGKPGHHGPHGEHSMAPAAATPAVPATPATPAVK